MNGIKHELVGTASAAAAAAAAYQNPLLYTPTPSWMGSENFPGIIRSIEMIDQQLYFFLRFIKFFFLLSGYCLNLPADVNRLK